MFPIEPRPTCPRWRRFVSEIFAGDVDSVEYLQRVIGYTLTGLTTEQTWFLCYGDGSNGKSTLLNVMSHVLGDYAKTVPFGMFDPAQRNAIPDDVATLIDRRYVTANETVEAAKLNEARIKMLTGGDRTAARKLYGQWFEFEPQLKLFLSCNHKPKVTDDSYGFWRRVHVIPFTQRFAKDQALVDTLKAEASGILNWMIEGCLLWQDHTLMPPTTVLGATSAYERESNPLNDFLAELCEEGETFEAPSKTLYDAYLSWDMLDVDKRRKPVTIYGASEVDRRAIQETARGRWQTFTWICD